MKQRLLVCWFAGALQTHLLVCGLAGLLAADLRAHFKRDSTEEGVQKGSTVTNPNPPFFIYGN
jgi:hypothetical protein